jgi:hypothetical protein
MVVAWLMVGMGETWTLDKTGAWAIESLVYFFIGALAVAFLGRGVTPLQEILPGDSYHLRVNTEAGALTVCPPRRSICR